MANRVRVMTICGTRPEFVRLSEIIKKLDKYTNHILVNTNQSYDYELNQVFFDELKIRQPDYQLDVKADTIGQQIGHIMAQTENVMLKEKPDAVLILGDTNSVLSAIIAKRLRIVVFHMEGGNRAFDNRVPEEINRKIIDHVSDINLCYTELARMNLLREGLSPQNIFVIGSPLVEVYDAHKEEIAKSGILGELNLHKDGYMLASIHREENVMDDVNLCSIVHALCMLADEYKLPVVFSAHPRTQKRIEDTKLTGITEGRVFLHRPFGLFDYITLQKNAFICLSDSGSIHEDTAILGLLSVNVRESQERHEVYDSGNVVISGVDADDIVNAVALVRGQAESIVRFSNPYGYETNCSDKVIRLIVGFHNIVVKKEYYL